jgi:hypothetical protein
MTRRPGDGWTLLPLGATLLSTAVGRVATGLLTCCGGLPITNSKIAVFVNPISTVHACLYCLTTVTDYITKKSATSNYIY